MELTKKKKLKQLLYDLSTPEEKGVLENTDKLLAITGETKSIGQKISTSESNINKEIKDIKRQIANIKQPDYTPLAELLSDIKSVLSKPRDTTYEKEFGATLQNIVKGLSGVDNSIKDGIKSRPVWRWPQYLYSGIRNTSFSPINPATEETSQAILAALGGGVSANVGTGQKNVTTAGTRVVLGSATCQSITVKAKATNTGLIYVGGSTVTSSTGFILSAGDSVSMETNNLDDIYLDSSVNGEGVSFLYVYA